MKRIAANPKIKNRVEGIEYVKDEIKFNYWTNVYGKCVLCSFMSHKTKVVEHVASEHQPFW